MYPFDTTERKVFTDHPTVLAVTALRELPPGAERDKLEIFPEFGHLPRDPQTGKIKYLSPSQIKTWTRCGSQYYYQYALQMRETDNSKTFFGTCVHLGGEVFLKTKREARLKGGSFDFESALQLAIAAARHYAATRLPKPIIWKPLYQKGPLETHESLIEGVGVAVAELVTLIWNNLDPVFVERGFVIEWKDTRVLPILVYPDLIHSVDDRLAILDTKTGAEKKELSINTDVAVPLGALAASLFAGVMITNGTYANYVRTKVPKVLDIKGDVTPTALERVYLRTKILTAALSAGIFMPADDDMTCNGCAYKPICWKWTAITDVPQTKTEFAELAPQRSENEIKGPLDLTALLTERMKRQSS